jgi:hypothetical protein
MGHEEFTVPIPLLYHHNMEGVDGLKTTKIQKQRRKEMRIAAE